METMEELVEKIDSFFSKKTPKEIGKYLARVPENVYKFIGMVYVEKQSVQKQRDICGNIFYYMLDDFQNKREI